MTPMRNGREGDGPPPPSAYSSDCSSEVEDLNNTKSPIEILRCQMTELSAERDAWRSQAQRFMKERDSARSLLYEVTSNGQITLDSLLEAKWQIRELLSVARAAVSWRESRKCSSHEIEVAQRDHLKDIVDALHPDALEEPNDG
jgi:hypothetical protein